MTEGAQRGYFGSARKALAKLIHHVSIDRLYQSVLLLYIFGISAFNRGFTRLHVSIAEVPLFVGEATMAILLALLVASALRTGRLPIRADRVNGALLVYLGIGSVFAIGGLGSGYGLAVFRDFALVYYLAFYFFAAAFVQQTGKPINLLRAMVAGASIGSLIAVIRFMVSPQLVWEHAASGALALLAWVALVYVITFGHEASNPIVRLVYVLALIAAGLTIFLSATRILMASIVGSLGLLWAARLLPDLRRIPLAIPARATAVALVLATFVLITAQLGEEPEGQVTVNGLVPLPEAVQTLSRRWVRGAVFVASLVSGRQSTLVEVPGVSHDETPNTAPAAGSELDSMPELETTSEAAQLPVPDLSTAVASTGVSEAGAEPTFSFRLDAWRNALAKIASSPLVGIGYGPNPGLHRESACDLPASPISNCGNAHNTYLTLVMRMGIPVFLFFVAINANILWRMLRVVSRPDNRTNIGPLWLLTLVAYLSFAIYALTNLFLESPYLSSLYWINLAVMHHLGSSHPSATRDLWVKAG